MKDAADRFAVRPVDDGTLVPAEGADAVAGAEEREVARHDLVEQRGQVGLGRRCAADFFSSGSLAWNGPPPRMMPDQSSRSSSSAGRLLQPDPAQLRLVQAGAAQHRRVLLVRRDVLRSDRQKHKGLHLRDSRTSRAAA